MNFKTLILGCTIILIGFFVIPLMISVFDLDKTPFNWIALLGILCFVLIGLYYITGLKILNSVNWLLIGVWLLLTPIIVIDFDETNIFLMVILYLPIGLLVIILGIIEIMREMK